MENLIRNYGTNAQRDKLINGKNYTYFERRGANIYDLMLFTECPTDIMAIQSFMSSVLIRALALQGRQDPDGYRYYDTLANEVDDYKYVAPNDMNQELGGRKKFFSPGSTVLELGNGAGIALQTYVRRYRKVNFIGLDRGNGITYPAHPKPGKFVSADWSDLPMANNSISNVFSLEGFPRWAGGYDPIIKTVENITRVCREGSQFRGTMLPRDRNLQVEESGKTYWVNERAHVLSTFVNNGWEVWLSPMNIIARLKNK